MVFQFFVEKYAPPFLSDFVGNTVEWVGAPFMNKKILRSNLSFNVFAVFASLEIIFNQIDCYFLTKRSKRKFSDNEIHVFLLIILTS